MAVAADKSVSIRGSDTELILNEELAGAYRRAHPGVTIHVEGGGSSLGIRGLLAGEVDIAAASRPITAGELATFTRRFGTKPLEVPVALDGIGVYVHNANPVTELTLEELRGIFTGKIHRWGEVGGVNRPIVIFNRNRQSGTNALFREQVLRGEAYTDSATTVSTTSAMVAAVSRNQGGIGYGGVAYAVGCHVIRIVNPETGEPVWPNEEDVAAGRYPLSRTLYYYAHREALSPQARAFIDWVRSDAGQRVVTFVGYFPLPGLRATPLPEGGNRTPRTR